ncbi:PIG-L deacetylase family protein [Micromonospora sp. NPDC023644]|uniref:PIG-L deacetylase family protein n=1 Tax=Micromonospora sp. NPDC023644 TaxID=3154321 RepID=UPI0033E5B404
MMVVDEQWTDALAIAAHPDDLEYGVSSALARWTSQGKRVTQLLVTRGEAGIRSKDPETAAALRMAEQQEAARIVGAEAVDFLAYPDGALEYSLALRRDLARAIRQRRPEVVVSLNFRDSWPYGESFNHVDHRMLGPAIVDAVRDAANGWMFPELVEEGLEPWGGVTSVLFSNSPKSNRYVEIGDHLEVGIRSLLAHRAYLADLEGFDAAAYLRKDAERTGRDIGVGPAVSFERIAP